MHVAVLIGVVFAGTLHFDSQASSVSTSSPRPGSRGGVQRSTTSSQKPAPHPDAIACVPLNPEQHEKRAISTRRPVCFTLKVEPGEAAQLLLDQPQDLKMRLTGGTERLVDGFDLGIETLTITTPGAYRVDISMVDDSPGNWIFSIVRWRLPPEKAAAWQQAETLATTSRKSRQPADIERSMELWEALGDSSAVARTYLKRGSALYRNSPANAREAFEKALVLCKANFDTRCSAEAENNSGLASQKLGDVDQAHLRLEAAAQNWQRLDDLENLAKTRSNLGIMLQQSGDVKQAIVSLDEAARILRPRGTVAYAKVQNNLGLCYQVLAEYGKARAYFEPAIAGFAGPGNVRERVRARINLGRNYMLAGHLLRARPVLEQALAEAATLNDLATRADALRNLAQDLWRSGDYHRARLLLEEALEVDRFDGDRRGQSSALHYLGLIAQKSGDIASARKLFSEAAELRRAIGLPDDAAESLFELADLEYHANNLDASRDSAEQALKLLESVRSQVPGPNLRASYYSRKRQFFDLLVDLAMTPGTPNAAVEGLLAAERGRSRSLIDLLSGGLVPQQPPPELLQQRTGIQHQLDYQLEQSPSLEREKIIQRLLLEDETLEARIRRTVADEKPAQPLKSIEQIQREYVPAGCALLEFHLGARQSYLWYVDAQRVQVFKLPPAPAIESEAASVAQSFGQIDQRRQSSDEKARFARGMRRLSAILLGELAGIELPQRLILVPDGILHRIPFAALRLPKAHTELGLTHDLLQVPSAAYLTVGRKPRPIGGFPQTILAVADPVFSLGDPRMSSDYRKPPGAGSSAELPRLVFNREIDTIEALVPPARRQTLRGFEASRARLERIRLGDFGVLHFSTHGLIDDQMPELSRIALSMVNRAGRPVDGFLRPYQLAQFHLEGSIVVLSACDTALGKQVLGEGLMGLTSSLLYAGGSQLVLTLTRVDAEASSDFLSYVYRAFLSGGHSMEHSLTLARRKMARSKRYHDPYYWASFVVIGRPTDAVTGGPPL